MIRYSQNRRIEYRECEAIKPDHAISVIPLRASLHELALCSPDPARLAHFYATGLGYRFSRDNNNLVGVGRERRLRIFPGPPNKLGYAAYALDSPEDLAALQDRLHRAYVATEILAWPGLRPGAIRFADPRGNVFLFRQAAAAPQDIPTLPRPAPQEQPLSAATQRPARIQHVVFASKDPNRLLDFFVTTLGFAVSDRVVDEAGVMRTAFVRCSPEHHSLAVFAAAENRLDHHCYEAGDWSLIRDWADHFASLRIPLKWGPGRHGPGNNLFVFVHDPDGNWVEISAELERVAHDRPAGNWPHDERTLNSWGIGLLRS